VPVRLLRQHHQGVLLLIHPGQQVPEADFGANDGPHRHPRGGVEGRLREAGRGRSGPTIASWRSRAP